MKRGTAACAAALLALASCRTTGPATRPAEPTLTAKAVSAVLAARDEAWRPRRFKALFRGEVSLKTGLSVRGYLSLFWDGETLAWRASVPLAGTSRTGTIRRSGGGAGELFPGRLASSDVLAALLGVPEELPTGVGAVHRGGQVELALPSGEGRAVLVSAAGEVSGLVLPAGVHVEITPGAGLPRRIDLRGPDGTAILTLESYGPWPDGEEGSKG